MTKENQGRLRIDEKSRDSPIHFLSKVSCQLEWPSDRQNQFKQAEEER